MLRHKLGKGTRVHITGVLCFFLLLGCSESFTSEELGSVGVYGRAKLEKYLGRISLHTGNIACACEAHMGGPGGSLEIAFS